MKRLCTLAISGVLSLGLLFSNWGFASDAPALSQNWNNWLEQVKQEAVKQGINSEIVDDVFDGMTPDRKVISLNRTQPEHRLSFPQYLHSRIDAGRIALGAREYGRHRKDLEKVGKEYGADPCVIAALWGLETSYGHYLGDFSVLRSLATLAYTDPRRSEFFRKELFIALHILNDGHIDLAHFKGEWAGASGQPQFLPSSWQRFAVDYDHDGHKNIWTTYPDAFASIANYLAENGWQAGEPVAIKVDLPKNFPDSLIGEEITRSVGEWAAQGVKPSYGEIMPDQDLPASILRPTGGPAMMVFQNFNVILKYNNSIYYAGAIDYLADQICRRVHHSDDVNF